MRVLAAMSGGVDSAVAAARAVDAGHDVVGVHLALSRNPATLRTGARGCCTAEDAGDARRAADVLGIPFYIWDLAERFQADVVDDFVAEYAAGRTPNPCLRCNEKIKFTALLDKARALGFDAVCTGHYAQLEVRASDQEEGDGERELHRAVDIAKDQSYVLAVLTREQLAGALFPLGGSLKSQVRAEAERRGLAVAQKADSHDICFIADGDTAAYLAGRLGRQPGRFVDEGGTVVGEHEGAFAFTVGQRHGLRLGTPAADGKPRYVLGIEPVSGQVTVGPAASLDVSHVVAAAAAFPSGLEATGLAGGRDCLAQVRAHAEPVPCTATYDGDRLVAGLRTPVRGVAAGQGLVLSDGSRVLAAGRIVSAGAAPASDVA
jgi:tRNA-specific 2-thiouridylase